jgi:hypothetical protein
MTDKSCLLTPDETRKQTCPLIRYCVNQDAVIQNGASAMHEHQACQGPDCRIGWRWGEEAGQVIGIAFDETVVVCPPTVAGEIGKDAPKTHRLIHTEARDFDDGKPALRGSYVRDFELHPRRGYCGAFGNPRRSD